MGLDLQSKLASKLLRYVPPKIPDAARDAILSTACQGAAWKGFVPLLVQPLLEPVEDAPQALAGARVQRGVVAQRIVERVMPADLVVLVRRGDTEGLAQRANLNEEQARKVVDALKNTEALYALETVELADRPRIELKDGDGYKDSSTLSTGQKCTTILPILLLDSDTPLMVDQPEDNLDNRFVCESVVNSIRKVKATRQLVFVTHNPNIPVLADAERVFVLESDGARSSANTPRRPDS